LLIRKFVVHFTLGDCVDELAEADKSVAIGIKIVESLFGIQDLLLVVENKWSYITL
jgi:hypothetical protein